MPNRLGTWLRTGSTPESGLSPIARWNFDISGTSIVDTVAGVIGSPILSTRFFFNEGKYDSGLRFSGLSNFAGFDMANTHPEFNFSSGTSFSLSAWIRLGSGENPNAIDTAQVGIITKGVGGQNSTYGLDIQSGTYGQVRFGTRSGGAVYGIRMPLPSGPNDWNHVVGRYTAVSPFPLQIFLNGSIGSIQNLNGSSFNDAALGSLSIGPWQRLAGNAYSGIMLDIDDVMIFDRALNFYEIQQIYSGGRTPNYNIQYSGGFP